MPSEPALDTLADLFRSAKEAHGKAFADRNGDDPDWPSWYADYLINSLNETLLTPRSKNELVVLLTQADAEFRQQQSGNDWAIFYAQFFKKHFHE
jgi:hypothetical protein